MGRTYEIEVWARSSEHGQPLTKTQLEFEVPLGYELVIWVDDRIVYEADPGEEEE